MISKEELKQEAEESAKKFFGKPTDLVDLDNLRIFKNGYLASAEPREKRIVELEDDVQVWKKASEDNSYKAFLLEKENAELKESFFVVRCVHSGCPYLHLETRNCLKVGGFFTAVSNKHCPMMQNLNSSIQLTKAKDIMKRFVCLSNSSRSLLGDTWFDTLKEAEQFLKENK